VSIKKLYVAFLFNLTISAFYLRCFNYFYFMRLIIWLGLIVSFYYFLFVPFYTIALISHASKVMLKILQARLQQYVSRELPDVQVGFRKGRGTRDQIANIHWIMEKAREFQKNIYFCFIDYAKAFDCVNHNKPWKILKEMGIPDHLTCLLRNLCAGKEATVRTGHGTTDWFQIGKGVHQGHILSPCLFNLYAEYIMRNAGLEEAQAGIKIARRNINNLRYADDTTLMAESEAQTLTGTLTTKRPRVSAVVLARRAKKPSALHLPFPRPLPALLFMAHFFCQVCCGCLYLAEHRSYPDLVARA